MRVINAMFGRKKGGIEQAFIDYCQALTNLGCEVTAVAYEEAEILKYIPKNVTVETMTNFGQWDPLASWKLKKLVKQLNPDVIITHGNRAASLFGSCSSIAPVVNVCHNYTAKQIDGYDALIAVSEDLRRTMIKKGVAPDKIYTVPNMIYVPDTLPERKNEGNNPPIIGTMGRFVAKKGFNVLLKSLSILKNRNVEFRAIIGGEGEEEENLKSLAANLGISNLVSFPGWIENKEKFFNEIDMFCLPSLHEPFGIVLLEAMMYSTPVITSDSEGPLEIVSPHIDGLVVEAGEPDSLADAIEKYLNNPRFATKLGNEGYKKVMNKFDTKMVGKRIYLILEKIISKKATKEVKDKAELITTE